MLAPHYMINSGTVNSNQARVMATAPQPRIAVVKCAGADWSAGPTTAMGALTNGRRIEKIWCIDITAKDIKRLPIESLDALSKIGGSSLGEVQTSIKLNNLILARRMGIN